MVSVSIVTVRPQSVTVSTVVRTTEVCTVRVLSAGGVGRAGVSVKGAPGVPSGGGHWQEHVWDIGWAREVGVGGRDGGRVASRRTVLTPQERLFAVEVERARAAARVSQEWVGRQIRLSRSKVSEVCCGRYLPTHDTVIGLIEALGMDREHTLRLWQDAQRARAERREGDRLARQTPVVGWQRLAVLPPEIMSLLQAQVLAAEELPYRLPGARRPSLSTVYVRQDLGSGIEETRADKRVADPDLLSHASDPDVLVGRLLMSWWAVASRGGHRRRAAAGQLRRS
jgi:Helix-turn-helix domain